MNTVWPSGRKAVDQAREALQRAWQETPAWARSPAALTGLAAFVMAVLLLSLAMVVQGVTQRGEERRHAQAEQVRSLWKCSALSFGQRHDDCSTPLAEARAHARPNDRMKAMSLAGTQLASVKQ
ncbi:MAG: hypothetical protein ABI605_10040 [Rhizobacter sp.]